MTTKTPRSRETAERPLELAPERVTRAARPPYAIVDIGSNSVRLIVYDQLGRAPMPRFNEKSLLRLGEGLAQTGAIAAEGFRRAVRRCGGFAPSPMRWASAGSTRPRPRRCAAPPMDRRWRRQSQARAGSRFASSAGEEEARYATLGVISGFFRPVGLVGDMGGGSLEVAEAIDDHVGDGWVSLPLGALPVEAMLAEGLAEAKRRVDDILRDGLSPALSRPVFYPVGGGWRSLAKAHMAVGAPVKVVHG